MVEHSAIEVLKIHAVSGTSPLKAFVDLRIGSWLIYSWRVIRQNGQRAYVQPPQVSWQGADGKSCYRPMLTTPPSLKTKIDVAILQAWEARHA